MAFPVVMPRLGWNMEAGSVAAWRKKDGEAVAAGEILFEVESEKALQEVEALESGILRIPPDSPPVGTSVPVGTPLAWLLAPGEQLPSGPAAPAAATTAGRSENPRSAAVPATRPERAATASVAGSAAPGSAAHRHPAISPRAKRVAGELGVDWSGLKGTGSTGRIVERDVRTAAASPAPARSGSGSGPAPLRAELAVLSADADATDLLALQIPGAGSGAPIRPSFGDFVIKLAAQALLRHSAANVRRDGASAVRPSSVDIGIAVETDRGLIVPVVRGVEAKSLRQIAGESAGLAERARSGALADGEIGGETIAVVDLGAFELDEFAPVGARFDGMVLAVGRVVARQVVTEAAAGRTAIRRMMRLSLAFDARLVDPAPAARLLQTVKRFVEQPLAWLIDA